MTVLVLLIGGERLEIELDTAAAPGLSTALAACLPHGTIAVHAQTAGPEFCVPVPFFHWHENRRVPAVGDVGYASFGNYACFYYGAMSQADGPTNVIGRVDDLDTLSRIGKRLLSAGAASARLLPARPVAAGKVVQAAPSSHFTTACGHFFQANLAHPPQAIRELREAALPGMGNMAGRLQAAGFLMGFAETLFLLRAHIVDGSIGLDHLLRMFVEVSGRYARWFEMSGMPSAALALSAIARAAAEPSKAEFLAGLESLLVSTGRLRLWADAVSPWHLLQSSFGDEAWAANLESEPLP